ncbi:hypothetical protein F5B22DRAFT_632301 [Xylaria bambusicola]|uniref:uncharacterized protein n=1 Tax=Xylaria bambusicola TaxID=326684 RepID=UPI0020084F92|nr:uncharacterized protein F5B22DRAFT_632301 [Xylaria bambusicola]KAI0502720.1 hypothetical protein F5B22DRAFT_632301 [Xylaria bambusicola]
MIFNVEVEIMEGQYTQHAASTQLEALSSDEHLKTKKSILPLLSYPGYSIAYLEDRPGEGTVGLHIKLGADNSTVYGLTCRHAVRGGRAKHESYKPSAHDRQYHISGSQGHLGDLQYDLYLRLKSANIDLKWQQGPIDKWETCYKNYNPKNVSPPTEKDFLNLKKIKDSIEHDNLVKEALEKIDDRKERQIGHLAYYPGCSISSRQPGYLRDWALVELDVRKFTLPPANKIFLGSPSVKYDELRLGLTSEPYTRVMPMCVSKIGQKSGLTDGIISGIEAVVRRPCRDGAVEYSWEMLIVPENGASYFSEVGDSGSAVFNKKGQVVAIVTASNKGQGIAPQDADETIPRGTDVTFATPIQWVLDDIEDFTGQRPWLV